jgi:hypothetical protein
VLRLRLSGSSTLTGAEVSPTDRRTAVGAPHRQSPALATAPSITYPIAHRSQAPAVLVPQDA